MIRAEISCGVFAALCLLAAGCSGPNPYSRTDLHANLSAATLERYEREWQNLSPADREQHMVRLERSNWWPLGLFLYHKDATVMRKAGPEGVTYHVMSGKGFGPLCVLYAVSTSATYNEKGERLSGMRMHNALLGHLLMIHETDAQLPGGTHEKASSFHLLHHIVAIDKMNGHTTLSFATIPNPISGSWMSHGQEGAVQ